MYLVVLFNLKPESNVQEYETWAQTTDVPTVKTLKSVDDFFVVRTTGLFGSDDKPPYQYVEVIRINDSSQFAQEAAQDTVQKVAAQFQGFADKPLFMICDQIA